MASCPNHRPVISTRHVQVCQFRDWQLLRDSFQDVVVKLLHITWFTIALSRKGQNHQLCFSHLPKSPRCVGPPAWCDDADLGWGVLGWWWVSPGNYQFLIVFVEHVDHILTIFWPYIVWWVTRTSWWFDSKWTNLMNILTYFDHV